jgi:hypothetical protein
METTVIVRQSTLKRMDRLVKDVERIRTRVQRACAAGSPATRAARTAERAVIRLRWQLGMLAVFGETPAAPTKRDNTPASDTAASVSNATCVESLTTGNGPVQTPQPTSGTDATVDESPTQ